LDRESPCYEPGEKGKIELPYPTAYQKGYRSRTLTVHSNDEENPKVKLFVGGNILAPFEISTLSVSLGPVQRGSEATAEITVRPLDEPEARLLEAETSAPFLQATVATLSGGETIEEGAVSPIAYTVLIALDSTDLEQGTLVQESICLRTSSVHQPERQVRVLAQIVGDVYSKTRSIIFPYLRPRQCMPRSFDLKSANKDQFVRIRNIRFVLRKDESTDRENDPVLTWKWEDMEEEGTVRVHLTLETGPDPNPLFGDLEIETTSENDPVYRMPVRAIRSRDP
jgi:hypothetical protein